MATFTLDIAPYDADGYVTISFQGTAQQSPSWFAWRVYWRGGTTGPWTLLQQYNSPQASYFLQHWLALPNRTQQWAVVQVTSTNGGQTLVEETYAPQTAEPVAFHYWLLHPTNTGMSMQLPSVTNDPFQEEFEEEELLIIGRGRKVDRGTSWGVSGSLTMKFRDQPNGTTGRQLRQRFSLLRREATFLWLRNPFGDLTKVALFGGTSYEREAGVGMREFVEADVEYKEVA